MNRFYLVFFLIVCFAAASFGQIPSAFEEIAARAEQNKGKRPVIVIPGILGSELVNKVSGEKVWFSVRRSKDDDLRLPVERTLDRSRDNLVTGDIIRSLSVLFNNQDFYSSLTQSFSKYGGYTEASIDSTTGSLKDKYFVFPYDWRRDNVESARLLLRKMEALRKSSGEKDIKFDIVSHSMGGLIARYAAMYGNRDLTTDKPKPNWAGGSVINQIIMFGTPNHGAADSLQTLLQGYGAIAGVNLPFVRDLTPLETFTMPALFQLLPHAETQLFYDENLEPIKIDLYDYRTWEKYQWSIYGDGNLFRGKTEAEAIRYESYLQLVLRRAKRFQEALDAGYEGPVKITVYGSECADTLDGFVLLKNQKTNKWKTMTSPEKFVNSKGDKVTADQVRAVMMKPGDGRVSKSSLLDGMPTNDYATMECIKHDTILSSAMVQRRLLDVLLSPELAAK